MNLTYRRLLSDDSQISRKPFCLSRTLHRAVRSADRYAALSMRFPYGQRLHAGQNRSSRTTASSSNPSQNCRLFRKRLRLRRRQIKSSSSKAKGRLFRFDQPPMRLRHLYRIRHRPENGLCLPSCHIASQTDIQTSVQITAHRARYRRPGSYWKPGNGRTYAVIFHRFRLLRTE